MNELPRFSGQCHECRVEVSAKMVGLKEVLTERKGLGSKAVLAGNGILDGEPTKLQGVCSSVDGGFVRTDGGSKVIERSSLWP